MVENIDAAASNDSIKHLVPSTKAYLVAWGSLVISGISGGFIGYAIMTIFFPGFGSTSVFIGTIIITVTILFSMNIMTSLGLKASVEWKAREQITSTSKRPSRLIK